MSAKISQWTWQESARDMRVALPMDRLLRSQWTSLYMAALGQSQQQNEVIQQTLEDDIRALDQANGQINETNGRSLALLESLTGEKLGDQPGPWQAWWAEQLGFSFSDTSSENKPSYTDTVEAPDIPVILPMVSYYKASCFAAGTLVQTVAGTRTIESLAIGDRVLSQDSASGALLIPARVEHDRARKAPEHTGSRSTARRLSPPASIGSGRPARDGRWHAT